MKYLLLIFIFFFSSNSYSYCQPRGDGNYECATLSEAFDLRSTLGGSCYTHTGDIFMTCTDYIIYRNVLLNTPQDLPLCDDDSDGITLTIGDTYDCRCPDSHPIRYQYNVGSGFDPQYRCKSEGQQDGESTIYGDDTSTTDGTSQGQASNTVVKDAYIETIYGCKPGDVYSGTAEDTNGNKYTICTSGSSTSNNGLTYGTTSTTTTETKTITDLTCPEGYFLNDYDDDTTRCLSPSGGNIAPTESTRTVTQSSTTLDTSGIQTQLNDISENSKKGEASGGSNCDTPPTCSGDPVNCAILQQNYKARCETEKLNEILSEPSLTTDQENEFETGKQALSSTSIDFSNKISDLQSLSNEVIGSCPPDHSISVDLPNFTKDFVISYAIICDNAAMIRQIFIFLGLFISVLIIFGRI